MDNLIVPLKNLINDAYAKDISKKVKSALTAKMLNGEFIGVSAPYGYIKNPKDKHKFIIDKEAAYNVKIIFNMILIGKSRKEIVQKLTDRNILPPSIYKIGEKIVTEDFDQLKKMGCCYDN